MKTLIIAFALTLVASFSFAQTRTDLKGPAAKNYKPWKDKNQTEQAIAMKSEDATRVQGPAAKNQKVWDKENQAEYTEVAVVSGQNDLKGPAAKNYKVWSDSKSYNSEGTMMTKKAKDSGTANQK
ncbi:hypothetical protein N6H18_14990 [Reichenbachiella agarivorans]|uniref:Uncharacterized protein n=1 Tax=Reichenbachiella agarivorans TaxID=2979464 RepID=A0ABY6CMB2_9BACT|nr:hypothetical protein [Reichenbachiella agarivorans]UXP31653.1 hypothetical protein N6H18_14990 [Reichenbachiella agarivorans]